MSTFIQIKDSIVDFLIYLKPTGAEQYLMSIGAIIGLFFSIAIGGMDSMIYALIALCIVDYISGMFAAFKRGQWDSSTGFVGLAKKAVILGVVALCNTVDTAMDTHALRQMAICAYALNEAGSIVENIDRAGWGEHIPAFIRNALARLQSKQEGTKDESKKI